MLKLTIEHLTVKRSIILILLALLTLIILMHMPVWQVTLALAIMGALLGFFISKGDVKKRALCAVLGALVLPIAFLTTIYLAMLLAAAFLLISLFSLIYRMWARH
ncbi:MAG: hypothetical protein DRJ31_03655 [Candidatus Methanomethylicota archaeon]|uniref:Uncharacterized protein n=1 Tax=Thermoproteota archaeon TaxID=2056631 RepID=A0A497ERC9_9CREN|nr:MAG: hypothetical protein DRJ31_03655 [Candidatus Verstraetearchaeota archaeon]